MPVGGEIIEANEALNDKPELVNKDPYGEGWMIKIKITDLKEIDSLLSPENYKKMISG
jgi:glycine cleavage system H protein